jgi:hypothetical protein
MGIAEIIASIDRDISTLQKARTLIATRTSGGRKRGRPSKSAAAVMAFVSRPAKKRKKRNLSPEGRKRIAEAQRRRWAAKRKAIAGAK